VSVLRATLNGAPITLKPADVSVAYQPPTWLAPFVSGAMEYVLEVVWNVPPAHAAPADTASA
jgi:hypothetical protein